jgi:PAS domain S-box-containing protein
MSTTHLIKKMTILGILVIDRKKNITFSNEIAKNYNYYFEHITDVAFSGTMFFSLYSYPAEVQIIDQDEHFLILIQPKSELIRLKKENEALQTEQRGLHQVIDSSFDGIVISDKDGIIIHQNPSYEQITGLSAKDLIGRNLKELEDEGVIDNSASLRALKENKAVTIIQKINTGVTVLVSAVPIRNKQGKIEKLVNNIRDLTHLKSLENEVKELEAKHARASKELETLKEQNDPKLSIIAHSNKMKSVVERTLRVSQIDSVVLIQGESGVGKEKIVNLIHRYSPRANGPLIKINCGAIPEALLESELFGYESGTFTGANQKGKAGLFEVANNGSIFLDEIGEMPLPLQVKLLRVLQEFEITRVGGRKPIPVNVRIIAATHQNLTNMIEQGTFREDLFYRLNIIPIYIPSLRERKEDVIPLIYHFLNRINQKYGINRSFTPEALTQYQKYDWPGNVRELQNLVERITLMSTKSEIDVQDIQHEMTFSRNQSTDTRQPVSPAPSVEIRPLKAKLEEVESTFIQQALDAFTSIRKAATALKIDQSTLVRKMQKYNIKKKK